MIRQATPADIERITAIYNDAIAEGGWTGDLDLLSVRNRHAWFLDHAAPYGIFVKEQDGLVVGYVALPPYRKGRKAFGDTCEINYYLASAYRGRSFGKALIDHAIEQAMRAGFHVMVAIILANNQSSIELLVQRGFALVGRVPEAAKIDGTYCDHVYLSRRLAA